MRLALHPRDFPAAPGVVDQDVDRAELAIGNGDHVPDRRFVGDVGLGRERGHSEFVGDFRRHLLAGVGVALRDQHRRALGREPAGDPATDAVAGAGDDRHPAGQHSTHDCPSQ